MRKLIWMLAALLALAPAAFAQTAQEMTDRCAFSSVGKKTLDRMTDGNYQTYWASSSNGSAYVEIEAEDAIGGARDFARRIQILDAYQPTTLLAAGLQITADGGDQGAKMQGSGGGRGKTSPIGTAAHRLIYALY